MKKKSIWLSPKGRQYTIEKAYYHGSKESFLVLHAVKPLKSNNTQVFESHQKMKLAGWKKV